MPADTPTKYMRPSPSPIPPKPTAEDQAAIDQRNLEIAEGRTKPEQACSDCGGEMVRRRIRGTEMSVPFCEQCECPTKPERTCPQCGEGVDWNAGLLQCDACGFVAISADPDKGAAIEKLNRELAACDELDRVRPGLHVPRRNGKAAADAAREVRAAILSHGGDGKWTAAWIDELATPAPEAEVTELERLRCLVKALEQEAQGLRGMVAEWNQRLAIARGQTAEWKQRYTAERSGNLDTRLKLVTALADLQALRERHGEPEPGPRTERAESRLADVPSFEFRRGPFISYGEDS
jgi:hypothetical protein